MNKVIGLLLMFGFLWYSIYSSAKEWSPVFIDIPSALIVIVITLGFMLIVSDDGDWKVLWRFICGAKSAVEDKTNGITTQQAESLCALLASAARVSLTSGFIGTLIGFVIILMNVSDLQNTAPSIAVAFITVFYGLILSELVFMPAYRIAANRYNVVGC